MPKIVVCEKLEDFKNLDSDSIAIISHNSLGSSFNKEKIDRLKHILNTIVNESDESEKHWFEVPDSDIELYEITKVLREINKRIKVFNEKIVPLELFDPFLKSGIIPVLII
jgi:hypothetical protein